MAVTLNDKLLGDSAPSKVYVGTFTRDIAGVNGNVSYTGVGFKPTSLEIIWVSQGAGQTGEVMYTPGATGDIGICYTTAWYPTTGIDCYPTAGGRQFGVILSLDNDGFTIQWTKTATPTGTIRATFTARA